jgi:hypothetical protein
MRLAALAQNRPPSEPPSWPERVADVLRRIFLPGAEPELQPVPVPVTIPVPVRRPPVVRRLG